jgi:chromosome segregation protein
MLKRLDLIGFKSFADRTSFEFPAGITGIVGPNGSGKCVVGSTVVTLADGRDVPIRDLVEAALDSATVVETSEDGLLTRENPHGIQILSLNPATLRLEPRPVAGFVKRQTPPVLVRVRTRSGREVVATPYHPLFTLEQGQLRALQADELKAGVRIAVPRRLPVQGRPVELRPFELLHHFQERDNIYVPNSDGLRAWAAEARTRFGTWTAWRETAQVPLSLFGGLLTGQAVHPTVLVRLAAAAQVPPPLEGRFKCSNTPLQMCLPPRFTSELARFLGLFVAEGRSTAGNQLRFVNSEQAINDEFEHLCRSLFEVEVHRKYYKPSAEDVLVYAKALQVILERLFRFRIASGSADKELPPQLFEAEAEVQWAFLSGLFEGDAYIRPGKGKWPQPYIELSSASARLARQVAALLLRLGVFAQIRATEKYASNTAAKIRRTYYSVYIYGVEQLRHVAAKLTFAGAKGQALATLQNLAGRPNPNLDLVPGVTSLVKQAARLAGLKVKPHRGKCPKLAAYVDQRCEASRPGLLEVGDLIEREGATPELARAQLHRLRTLATSDIYWDEIGDVEQVPPPEEWVYDLCVAETHNFVANNILVHNSNIVDSIKWVLGEQSAKSLRGGEMADVIFNGSASRKSLGLAEVTMVFDNSRRALAIEAEEVQISRRVYRSGEGEYLINGQICRLKDVKNLFLGSGAGTDAYCIIEQGRVDVLLQASTRERRVIFEEAAGISRFKAKKAETARRLERVDQNVQRLRDIIDEVEKRLRGVKLQAAKAQRFQEYSERLKELRVGLGLQEYHQLSERLQAARAVLEGLQAELSQQTARTASWEEEMRRLESAQQELDETAHRQEATLAAARQQIATAEGTLGHEWSLTTDLEADLAQTRSRLAGLNARVAGLAEAAVAAGAELHGVESRSQEQRQALRALEEALAAAVQRLTQLQAQVQDDKDRHLEQMRQSARLQNDAVSFKAQVDNLRRERERLRLRSEQAAEQLSSLDLELQELTAADETLQGRLASARQTLADQRQERERLRRLRDETGQLVADLRARRSGLASRVEVLEGLERSHEGLGAGVREVLALLEQPDPGPWRKNVLGMVADFLRVRHEYAPLLDLALGEQLQRFLVRDPALLDEALRRRGQPFSSRVSFVTLTPRGNGREAPPCPAPPRPTRQLEASPPGRLRPPLTAEGTPAHPGVVALASQLATCDHAELADLPAQLLGRTLLVRDLATARLVAAGTSGFRFVTLQGELLEADGTLTVGTHHAEMGILSRKSELRELREQVADVDRRIAGIDNDLAVLRDRISRLDQQSEQLQQEIDVLAEQAADLRTRIVQHRQRREGLHEEVSVSRSEISSLEQEITTSEASWQQARDRAAEAERQVHGLHTRVQQAEQEIRELEERREKQQQENTAARVALGKVEERLQALRARHQQLDADLQQRRQERGQVEQHLAAARARLEESTRTMLEASSLLAACYLEKEWAERELAELGRDRERLRQERQRLAERMQTVRSDSRSRQEEAHARELEVNDLRHHRDTLVERLREDYQLDLAELYTAGTALPPALPCPAPAAASTDNPSPLPSMEDGASSLAPLAPVLGGEGSGMRGLDPAQANEEIVELRRKLSRLGSVNLDSLQELADLETRAASLQAQYDDLISAERALADIIARINADSRRLFTETFTTIRSHFQDLFRKLFGGGQADVVLEDENDVLESGIEVIARPPGKELRSISLMSGGEKTMTAVALLLAIFRSKPSPFCILDEVDAALDEANIGRFTAVLRDFLDRSQFIIITHSKRTMAATDVLYGITMQESGISKRVAINFQDWPDDGAAAPANGNTNGAQKPDMAAK